MTKVKNFKRGAKANYEADEKDGDTLYFVSDNGDFDPLSLDHDEDGDIYLGETLLTKHQIQSDWEQSGLTSADFIKHKPSIKSGTGNNSIIECSLSSNDALDSFSHSEGRSTLAFSNSSHAEGSGEALSVFLNSSTDEGSTEKDYYLFRSNYKPIVGNVIKYNDTYVTVTAVYDNDMITLSDTLGTLNRAVVKILTSSAKGVSSHTEGLSTITNNEAEHAEGKYNVSNTGSTNAEKTISSIGIGTDNEERKNAVEVMLNGDVYVLGIGDYDGTDISSANTLREVIENSENVQSNWTNENENSPSYIQNRPNVRTGIGTGSIIEGDIESNDSSGEYSHSEGSFSFSDGNYSHAEGYASNSKGVSSHSEGSLTVALGTASHAEGSSETFDATFTKVSGEANTYTVRGNNALKIHVGNIVTAGFGVFRRVISVSSQVNVSTIILDGELGEGDVVQATVLCAANGASAHTEGKSTMTINEAEHAEGMYNKPSTGSKGSDKTISTIGIGTSASFRKNAIDVRLNGDVYIDKIGGYNVDAEPDTLQEVLSEMQSDIQTISSIQSDWEEEDASSSSYIQNKPSIKAGIGTDSIEEGSLSTNHSIGTSSHAEGSNRLASGNYSHSEGSGYGFQITISGNRTTYTSSDTGLLKEGYLIVYGDLFATVVSVSRTQFSVSSSLGQLTNTIVNVYADGAFGTNSHVEGLGTIALNANEHAEGQYNVSNQGKEGNTISSIGFGRDNDSRRNAIEVLSNGSVFIYGVGDYDGTNIDRARSVNSSIHSYTIESVSPDQGTDFLTAYQLKEDGVAKGAKINIPKDMVVSSGEVKTVTVANEPYTGAQVGDKYIDLTIANAATDHLYIPVKDLVDMYYEGNGIDISSGNVMSVVVDPNNSNGLSVGASGVALATATTSSAGAMSAADKTKLDGIEPADIAPLMDGDAAIGTSTNYALEDHVHPSDTSKQNVLVAGHDIDIQDIVEIEYLESTGTQYIDTLVVPKNGITIEIKWRKTSTIVNYIFGGGNTSSNSIRAYSDTSGMWRYGGAYNALSTNNTIIHTATISPSGIILDNVNYTYSGTIGTFSTPDYPILLFGYLTDRCYAEIYYCKIYDGNNLVRDFIPIRIGTTGYMLDKISGRLFGNNGTGDFMLGPDVHPLSLISFVNNDGFITSADIANKADKVSNATNGNFAGLNSAGNLTDSGHKHGDYVTALGTSGNYVTWTKNGTANNLTVPYASVSGKLGTSTVGASNRPIFLSSGTPTAVTSVGEAFLSWGGKDFQSTYGPIDASMIPELGANRTQFLKPQYVSVEYSRDGGETWLDYEATDSQKGNVFSVLGLSGLRLGKATTKGEMTSSYMLRVTITDTLAANLYTTLRKFVIYDATEGSTGCYCTIQGRTAANVSSDTDTWVTFRDSIDLGGWSGYNVINYPTGFTTYGNQNSQYRQVRFIFGCTSGPSSSYYGFQLGKIMCFGGNGWSNPSNMAKHGHIYSWDYSQNATFPARITAPTVRVGANGNITEGMVFDGLEIVDLMGTTKYPINNHYIDYKGDWISSTTYGHYAIPIEGVRAVRIKSPSNSASASFFTFVKNYVFANPPTSDYAEGYWSRNMIPGDAEIEVLVPSDAEYLIIYPGSKSAQQYKPESLKLYGDFSTMIHDGSSYYGHMGTLTAEEAVVSDWRNHDVTSLVLSSLIRNGYIESNTNKYISGTYYSSFIPLSTNVSKIKLTAGNASTKIAFLHIDISSNVVVSYASGTPSILVNAGETVTMDVPNGTLLLYIFLGTLSNNVYSSMPKGLCFTGNRGVENFQLKFGNMSYDGSFETTMPSFTGATANSNGVEGLVTAPMIADKDKFLKGDGTWAIPEGTLYSDFVGSDDAHTGSSGLVPAPSMSSAPKLLTSLKNNAWLPINSPYLDLCTKTYVDNMIGDIETLLAAI